MKRDALLAGQVTQATGRVHLASILSEDPDWMAYLGQAAESLRRTYACVAKGLVPRDVAKAMYALEVTYDEEHVLRHRGKVVPVEGRFLKRLFCDLGVDLSDGQVILLDPKIARGAIELTLSELAAKEAALGKEMRVLAQALTKATSQTCFAVADAIALAEVQQDLSRIVKRELLLAWLEAEELRAKTPDSAPPPKPGGVRAA